MGYPIWGSDTGGYYILKDREVFARWIEFSAAPLSAHALAVDGVEPRISLPIGATPGVLSDQGGQLAE